MLYVALAMAYGDCMVSLSLLEQLPGSVRPYRVLGTEVTQRVSQLLRKPLPVTVMLPDKAAFYTIKERGGVAALSDFITMRRFLASVAGPGDLLAFERQDWRNVLLKPAGCEAIYAPRGDSAYVDRQALVRRLFGVAEDWVRAPLPDRGVRSVLINPCARYRHRWLSDEILHNLFAIGERRGWTLVLVDPCAQYERFKGRVAHYVPRPALQSAAALLRAADLYIGPDSFFVHLAYYFRVPHFGFFYPDNLYFLTPGMVKLGNYCLFADAARREALDIALARFIDRG
jgi:hypothetical protein